MPIEFLCTGCRRRLRTGDETAGKQARCPQCGAIMIVPGMAAAPPETGPQAAAGPETPATAAPAGSPFAPESAGGAERPRAPLFFDVEAYAASRVAGPATWLIVTAAIGIALAVFGAVGKQARLDRLPPVLRDAAGRELQFPFPVGDAAVALTVAGTTIRLLMGIIVLIGAVKMKRLESYGLAMASAILAMIPCTSPCCLLGLPFGIWALVVLSDTHVKAAFRS